MHFVSCIQSSPSPCPDPISGEYLAFLLSRLASLDSMKQYQLCSITMIELLLRYTASCLACLYQSSINPYIHSSIRRLVLPACLRACLSIVASRIGWFMLACMHGDDITVCQSYAHAEFSLACAQLRPPPFLCIVLRCVMWYDAV